MSEEEIRIDRDIDRALSIAFLCLVGASVYGFIIGQDLLVRIEILSSVPLNLLAAWSFWSRVPAREATHRREVAIPAISFLIPFAVTNNIILIPAEYGSMFGLVICVPGVAIAVWSFLTIRRSFAIMPAVRGIVDSGPYRYVRHPLYLGEFVYIAGMMVLAFNNLYVVLLILSVVFLVMRINIEERKLAKYPEYATYMKEVRYRLLPGIF